MQHKISQRLKEGDKVAIVSPSSGLAFIFPWVYQLGLLRLKEIFKLQPIEMEYTLATFNFLNENPQARASDINTTFSDPKIKAIIATTGGNDQIRILPYLDKKIIQANPKIFLGYSDNTNMHLYLWKLGIVSYYGGSIMSQFAMQGAMHLYTIDYIKKALFETQIGQIAPSEYFTDFDLDWSDKNLLSQYRPLEKNIGWEWYNFNDSIVQGTLWGGCMETLFMHLAIQTYLPTMEEFNQIILYIETSEEMPSSGEVYRFFATLAQLDILPKLKALLVGRPKSQFLGTFPAEGREQYIKNQKSAIKQALIDYKIKLPVIFNMDFGHTDPQIIIPNGGTALINSKEKTISFN